MADALMGPIDSRASGLSLVDSALCFYLTLPVLVFCGWFKWPVAVGLLILILLGWRGAFRHLIVADARPSVPLCGTIAIVALVWTALAGTGHFFYANDDWLIRDAVLRDLVSTAWPPRYEGSPGDASLILRAPVGYYLPAAWVGSLFGLKVADVALYFWTALGFGLFLWAASTLFTSSKQRSVMVLVLIAFGGLDLIGWCLSNQALPQPGEHLEWWAHFAQYSSNSTALFWVPNHALPAWLGITLVLRHWKQPALMRLAPCLLAVTPLWSPLATIGLFPFLVVGLRWQVATWRDLSLAACVPWLGLAGLIVAYITMDASAVPGRWAFNGFDSLIEFLQIYAVFAALEFGFLLYVLTMAGQLDLRLSLAGLVLLALPWYRFGIANDLVMRASLPALTVLALATIQPLTSNGVHPVWRGLLILVLGVGALGAAQEPIRAFLNPRWDVKSMTLKQVVAQTNRGELPSHYVAKLKQPLLKAMMREPAQVMPSLPSPSHVP